MPWRCSPSSCDPSISHMGHFVLSKQRGNTSGVSFVTNYYVQLRFQTYLAPYHNHSFVISNEWSWKEAEAALRTTRFFHSLFHSQIFSVMWWWIFHLRSPAKSSRTYSPLAASPCWSPLGTGKCGRRFDWSNSNSPFCWGWLTLWHLCHRPWNRPISPTQCV